MQTPTNTFKQALQAGRPQIGLWLGLADAYVSELLAGTGYDWLLVDGEHAPNDLRSTLAQLQAIASARQALPAGDTSAHAVVRIPHGDAALIKQNLDIGAQTLLVPMVACLVVLAFCPQIILNGTEDAANASVTIAKEATR